MRNLEVETYSATHDTSGCRAIWGVGCCCMDSISRPAWQSCWQGRPPHQERAMLWLRCGLLSGPGTACCVPQLWDIVVSQSSTGPPRGADLAARPPVAALRPRPLARTWPCAGLKQLTRHARQPHPPAGSGQQQRILWVAGCLPGGADHGGQGCADQGRAAVPLCGPVSQPGAAAGGCLPPRSPAGPGAVEPRPVCACSPGCCSPGEQPQARPAVCRGIGTMLLKQG